MIKQHIYWDITLHLSKYPDPIKKVINELNEKFSDIISSIIN